MKTHDFYYDLPERLIAQHPLEERTSSRLLVLDKNTGAILHRHFSDLPEFLKAGDVLVNKSQMSAQQLGISYGDLLELFKNEKGYISDVVEQETNFQFFTIVKKYEAKMLSLSDVVQPETTVTVYDYIKQSLGQQKQMEYLTNAAGEIAASLDTEENVERKKKGADLDKLLNW